MDLYYAWEAKGFSGQDKIRSAIVRTFTLEDARQLRSDAKSEVLKKEQSEKMKQSRKRLDVGSRMNRLAVSSSRGLGAQARPLETVLSGKPSISFTSSDSRQQKCAY